MLYRETEQLGTGTNINFIGKFIQRRRVLYFIPLRTLPLEEDGEPSSGRKFRPEQRYNDTIGIY